MILHEGRGGWDEEGESRLDRTSGRLDVGGGRERRIRAMCRLSGLGNYLDGSRINTDKSMEGMKISWGRKMSSVSGMMCLRCQGTCSWVEGSGILLASS